MAEDVTGMGKVAFKTLMDLGWTLGTVPMVFISSGILVSKNSKLW
ncbi:hypothetical protein [Bacillus sp. 7884-1]|nr:hypothetical protein [Bacillus sp. 7884-1]